MTSTKGFLSAAWIVGFFLLTLPSAGCNVSNTGLGHTFDAADGPRQTSETNPATNPDARSLLPDIRSEVSPSAAPDLAADRVPSDSTGKGPEVPSPEVASPAPDVAREDTGPAADVPDAFEHTLPDIPLVSDGATEPLPLLADGPDGPLMVPPDGPAIDTKPAASPDVAPADLARDLSALPDLSAPDLAPADAGPQPTVDWVVDNTTNIGGFTPTVMGSPTVTAMDAGTAVCFDGTKDGLLLATNPIQGMQRFTVEALVYPEFTGVDDPRLIHLGDTSLTSPRLIIQMRSDASGNWHAFIGFYSGGITTNIEDTTFTHPSNQWYWLAVTYDGQTARVYVNGVLENTNALVFDPLTAGSTSLGTRQNGQYYFPGCIREVEFFSRALTASQLSKP